MTRLTRAEQADEYVPQPPDPPLTRDELAALNARYPARYCQPHIPHRADECKGDDPWGHVRQEDR